MTDPLVTIITGYYNRGHVLERTLDALLGQTYPNIEIIVFDDCSKDDTREKLQQYRSRCDPRLVIIEHETNIGFTQGMINAIAISRGKYIAVQGSGDVSTLDRIEKQVRLMEVDPGVCVVGSFYENIIEDTDIVRPRRIIADDVTLASMMRANVFSHGEVMMRKTVYESVGGYRKEFRYGLDYDLWLRMITKGRFATVRETLYKRYVQFDGVSYEPRKFLQQARYAIVARELAKISGQRQAELLRRLRDEGPETLVPSNSLRLQLKVLRASVRAAIWGDSVSAVKLAAYIENRSLSALTSFFGRSFNAPMFDPVRKLVYKSLSISSG